MCDLQIIIGNRFHRESSTIAICRHIESWYIRNHLKYNIKVFRNVRTHRTHQTYERTALLIALNTYSENTKSQT